MRLQISPSQVREPLTLEPKCQYTGWIQGKMITNYFKMLGPLDSGYLVRMPGFLGLRKVKYINTS